MGEFIQWFDVIGSSRIDPITGRVTVKGSCRLKFFPLPNMQGKRKLPFVFDHVSGDFSIDDKGLTTLEGCPPEVGGSFFAGYNPLEDLKGGPDTVGRNYFISHCDKLTSLEGYATTVNGKVQLNWRKHLPLLKLLNAKQGINFYTPIGSTYENLQDVMKVSTILDKYAGQGRNGSLACGAELAKAGFKENARW